jgi:predicted lipid-binding transport protein (Tim44 family)
MKQQQQFDGRDDKKAKADANLDPITKAPGAHPVGTGVGATVGGVAGAAAAGMAASAATGAAFGSAAGPIGTAAGLVIGAVVGGLAGKGVAEKIDPTVEDAYWRSQYNKEPYYADGARYEDYHPAYQTAYRHYGTTPSKRFEDAEPTLRADYEKNRGGSALDWERARPASRSAWDRIEKMIPGDSDRDGK